jgi:hypothetical protein
MIFREELLDAGASFWTNIIPKEIIMLVPGIEYGFLDSILTRPKFAVYPVHLSVHNKHVPSNVNASVGSNVYRCRTCFPVT